MAVERARRALVVGGGIAGLAAAYRLTRIAPGTSLTLVDSARRLGGKILTERRDGFIIEGGPDSFLSIKPGALELCLELGLEERLRGTEPETRRTFVSRRGRLFEIPEGFSGLVPTRLGPILRSRLFSPLGKARMGLEALLPPRRSEGDESLASFVTRRLGREAYERLLEPLMAGIYAGDGHSLSLQATFPQLRDLERLHGGIWRGLRARGGTGPGAVADAPAPGLGHRSVAAGGRWPAFLTLAGGLEDLVWALSSRLADAEVRLGCAAERLQRTPQGFSLRLAGGETLAAGAVVLAVPAPDGASLLSDLDADLAAGLRAIPHLSTATVALAWPQAQVRRALDGYGYIVPRSEGRAALACTWTSSKFPHRAPQGQTLIRVFIGRAGDAGGPDLDRLQDEEIAALARAEAGGVLGVTAPPALARVFRWPAGMPQYNLGHPERVAAIEARLARHPGLFLAGNALRGVGLPDCIRSGEAAAADAAAHLGSGMLRRIG